MEPYYDDGTCVIYHGDCREVLPSVCGDLIVFDPPYNVCKGYDGYNDDLAPGDYDVWLSEVLSHLATAARGQLVWFPGTVNVPHCFDVLTTSPWRFERLLGWHKREYAGDLFTGGPAMCWEPIVWASLGERLWNRVYGAWGRDFLAVNSTHGDPLRREHPCPKPPEVLRWLVGLFCPAEGVVLDPTMGNRHSTSGSEILGSRRHRDRTIGAVLRDRGQAVGAGSPRFRRRRVTCRDWLFFGCVFFLSAVVVGVFLSLLFEREEPVSDLRRRQLGRLVEETRIR